MDYGFFKAFEQLCKDVAEIKADIKAMKDLQTQINAAYEKSQKIEDKARDALATPAGQQ